MSDAKLRGRLDDANTRFLKHRLALAQALMDLSWEMPVVFRREDHNLVGTFKIEVMADLETVDGRHARDEMAKLLKGGNFVYDLQLGSSTMNASRRGFLALLCGAAAAPMLPPVTKPRVLAWPMKTIYQYVIPNEMFPTRVDLVATDLFYSDTLKSFNWSGYTEALPQ